MSLRSRRTHLAATSLWQSAAIKICRSQYTPLSIEKNEYIRSKRSAHYAFKRCLETSAATKSCTQIWRRNLVFYDDTVDFGIPFLPPSLRMPHETRTTLVPRFQPCLYAPVARTRKKAYPVSTWKLTIHPPTPVATPNLLHSLLYRTPSALLCIFLENQAGKVRETGRCSVVVSPPASRLQGKEGR